MYRTLVWMVLILPWAAGAQPPVGSCTSTTDYVDASYGGRIRQIEKPEGHEHNLYYYRDAWNADQSYMVGVHSDLQHQDWRVVLYDGAGCFIKELFLISRFDWRLAWDRRDPEILYTWRGSGLYRYNVTTDAAELLKSFAPLGFKPSGPSLNQAGDRILVVTSDGVFRSYRLPEMDDERSFTTELAARCEVAWDKPRYIGYCNYISAGCPAGTAIYDDTGALVHMFEGIAGGGHHDFSPDGKWAYLRLWSGGQPLEIHVVNVDGTDDRVVYSVPDTQLRFVRNLHLAWPSRVSDWFVASFFPDINNQPSSYAPMLDEIVQIHVAGPVKVLARTETASGDGSMFWAQPLARPSADGSRINFNSARSGTIDQYILFLERPAPQIPPGGIVNAASFAGGPITPGEIVTVFGSALGPAVLANLKLKDAGTVDNVLAETRVLFDGQPAPLIYTQANQVSAVVPYSLAGRTTTRVQVEYRSARSEPINQAVAESAPGIFTWAATGKGPGAILNQDGSLNSAPNPATKGSIITLFATGEGQTVPEGVDGKVTGEVRPRPRLPVSVRIGGSQAGLPYVGAAPGMVAGVLQVNARVPSEIASGNSVAVLLSVGSAASQPGVTMAVR